MSAASNGRELVVSDRAALAQLDELTQALAAVETAHDAETLVDYADALAHAAQKARLAEAVCAELSRFRLRAKRRYGELLGPALHGGDRRSDQVTPRNLIDPADRVAISRARKLAAVDEAIFADALAADHPDDLTEARILREAKLATKRETERQAVNAPEAGQAIVHQMPAAELLASVDEIDLLLTDPPFLTDIDGRIEDFVASWLPAALDRMSERGRAYVFCGAYPEEVRTYIDVMLRHPWPQDVQQLVWTYRNTLGPDPRHRYTRNLQFILTAHGPDAPPLRTGELVEKVSVFDYAHPARSIDRRHQWQKPDALMEMLVRHGSDPGDLVIDPFAGSGTTLSAAARLGRHAIGSDIDPEAVAICAERGVKVANRPSTEASTETWTERELELRAEMEAGRAVVVNLRGDQGLIEWAKAAGRFVRIDRKSKWGNPYKMPADGDRDQVCNLHADRLSGRPDLIAALPELRGQALACWCAPERCHGDELARRVNASVRRAA